MPVAAVGLIAGAAIVESKNSTSREIEENHAHVLKKSPPYERV